MAHVLHLQLLAAPSADHQETEQGPPDTGRHLQQPDDHTARRHSRERSEDIQKGKL